MAVQKGTSVPSVRDVLKGLPGARLRAGAWDAPVARWWVGGSQPPGPGELAVVLHKGDVAGGALAMPSRSFVNLALARSLGLPRPWAPPDQRLYKLVVFVPAEHLAPVRDALATAGAGHIGRYSDCTFATRGVGTFRPREGTHPYAGQKGELTLADEWRLETVVPKDRVHAVLAAMHAAHPYEEVAYDLIRMASLRGPAIADVPAGATAPELQGAGRVAVTWRAVRGDAEIAARCGASRLLAVQARGLDEVPLDPVAAENGVLAALRAALGG